LHGSSQIEEEVLTEEEDNNLVEEDLQPKEKEPVVQVIKDIRRMTLEKEGSLLEVKAEARKRIQMLQVWQDGT